MRSETNRQKVEELMKSIGRESQGPGCVYFTGGATAVLIGWRDTTVDVDLKFDPEPKGIFQAIPQIKDTLQLNLELAAPEQFIPPLPGWRERSLFIGRYGATEFYHYDLYSQALAKIERGHHRDRNDVDQMMRLGLVESDKLRELFHAIEPDLIRYPSIDVEVFRQRVLDRTSEPGIE